jgi:ABC-type multidrug transport system ATPase subunit
MFSGDPGCGKTSTIKAIANETKRHVIEVHLSDIKTNAQLKHLFYNEELMVFNPVTNKAETLHIPISERLYVIEDIDAMKSVVLKRTGNGDSSTTRVEENEDEEDTSKLSYAAFAGFSKSDMNTK